jgi:hypothetical protein
MAHTLREEKENSKNHKRQKHIYQSIKIKMREEKIVEVVVIPHPKHTHVIP